MDDLLVQLQQHEVTLHQPAVRADRERLGELLHEDFEEIGRSGSFFTREGILDVLPEEQSPPRVHSQDYRLRLLSQDMALLYYRSAHADRDGVLSRFTRRASLWQRGPDGWKIRYHQGTPCEAFEAFEASEENRS